MKSFNAILILFIILPALLGGCAEKELIDPKKEKVKIGMMLVDYGLGDQSFNDNAFLGLIEARDELGILFDYRSLNTSQTYEKGLIELIEQENSDLVIGLGQSMVEDFTKVAKKYPQQQFLFIDQTIDLPNVSSVTFKEEEGSFLVGVIAGLKTNTDSLGFVGGMDISTINKFRDGFISGVKSVNPGANIFVDYTNGFGNSVLGGKIAAKMIDQSNVDIIYSAAGFSGLGVIEEAGKQNVYAIGVDSDQFFVAEDTVITSMLKNVDVAVYSSIKEFVENGSLAKQHKELGVLENGVGYAPIRIISLTKEEEIVLDSLTEDLYNGTVMIQQFKE